MNEDIVLKLAKLVEFVDSFPAIINLQRVKDMQRVYDILESISKENGLSVVTYNLNKPYKNMGDVSIECEEIVIADISAFLKAAYLANNLDVYPLANNHIKICFGFNDLTEPII